MSKYEFINDLYINDIISVFVGGKILKINNINVVGCL